MRKKLCCLSLSLILAGACNHGNNGPVKHESEKSEQTNTDNTDSDNTDSDNTDTDDDTDSDTDADTDSDTDDDDPDSPVKYNDTIITWRGKVGQVVVSGDADNLRTYTLKTNAALRDNDPASKEKVITEGVNQMRLRSGHRYFDALWALAMEEARQDSVSKINNGDFNNGQNVDCNCFNTGKNWEYVWTRDTAYAMDLGLALVDPTRAMNSLLFKISSKKDSVGGGNVQIVQDTGSGGSWPVSTDRVIWGLGAYETLKYLSADERATFASKAYEAIKNTIEADREVIYDPADGLYSGEQSYLDWRQNTYQPWTYDDVVHIAMAKTFSTNTAHYINLTVAAKLASELGKNDEASKYNNWASELKKAIVKRFDKGNGLFSSMTGTYLDSGIHSNYDALGQALAILWDVVNAEQAKTAIASYPLVEAGPPVIWPQQPKTWIYHNRAIWPFVTGYHLRAALKADNAKVVDNAFTSLVRGAAFNLSNMENYEFMTLAAWADDESLDYNGNKLSGPVVNSQRQLWSIGGYISAVLYGIFGMETTQDTIWFNPRITANIRNVFLAGSNSITLHNMKYHGKVLNITIKLPAVTKDDDGFFAMSGLTLNGTAKTAPLTDNDLAANNEIVITLKNQAAGNSQITLKTCTEDSECYAPQMPYLESVGKNNGQIQVAFSAPPAITADLQSTYNIYRDGQLVAQNVSSPWIDTAVDSNHTYCYSVTAVNKYGNESHHAKPICLWLEWQNISADDNIFNEHESAFNDHGKRQFGDWGRPGDVLHLSNVKVNTSGDYLIQLEYGNGFSGIDTGIACAVKRVKITAGSTLVADDVVIMPTLGYDNWDRWETSSYMPVSLTSGVDYSVTISDVFNMSYFDHFTMYGGRGGGTDVTNRVNLATFKLLLKDKN